MLATLAAAVVGTHRGLGMCGRLRPPGDIAVGGRKIAAQPEPKIGGSVVVGGTFLFDFDAVIIGRRCLNTSV